MYDIRHEAGMVLDVQIVQQLEEYVEEPGVEETCNYDNMPIFRHSP